MSKENTITVGTETILLPFPVPWGDTEDRRLLIGQHLISKLGYRSSAGVQGFVEKHGAESVWPAGEESARVRVHSHGSFVILELSAARHVVSERDVDDLLEILEEVCRTVSVAMDLSLSSSPEVTQEFASLDLPAFMANRSSEQVSLSLRSRDFLLTMNTLEVSGRRLRFGPERPGSLKALRTYLQNESSLARRAPPPQSSETMLVPWILAGLLLATWLLPLTPVMLGLAFGAMCVPIGYLIRRSRAGGWRSQLRRTGTLTSLALFSISIFGAAYGVCALAGTWPQYPEQRLGDSFLIATSLGLAGGVVGDALSGCALIIAHVQLLLFLGGLAALIAAALRIEDILITNRNDQR